ncbi:2513_t:CDS:2, partial [Gigaspora rosea]
LFNLEVLFRPSRAKLIRQLWDHNSTNSNNTINGLYLPSQVTPYIHIFVYHGWELMQKHKRWGIKAFSCAAVERKNHDQVSLFFRKTLKNGGDPLHRKASVVEILEYENHILYYIYNNIQPQFNQNKRLRIC